MDDQELTERMQKLLIVMQRLDEKIAPMLEADGEHFSKRYHDVYHIRNTPFTIIAGLNVNSTMFL